jgi:hypothetical protein
METLLKNEKYINFMLLFRRQNKIVFIKKILIWKPYFQLKNNNINTIYLYKYI